MTNKVNKVLAGCFLGISLAFVSSIAMAATVPGKIAGTDVNLRKNPTTSASIISKLTNSDVTVIDKSNGWYKVSYNQKTGWVSDDYLKLISANGTINANGVNFRTGPGTSTKKITTLNKNTGVVILDTANGWNKVKIGTKIGYVASNFVANSPVQTASVKAAAVKSATTTSASAIALKTADKVSRSVNTAALAAADAAVEEAPSINEQIISYAKQFNGVRYLYGGNTPQTGFDCSGFIGYVFKKFGINLNRSAEAMYSNGIKVSKSQLEAGDILFFDASSRKASGRIDHAGIYIGGDSFIHASSSNGAVRIQKLSEYRGTYIGAKRVIK
ncbi:C40 family peptidase [Ruminiclostridium cellobioparum]|uniref:C40 family peptidase n=1 Tax=Ruminiclostridium cellobioparum TaxID=29355 RepID=UPI000487FC4F|nr:C40 family peptidase [Ruminiclostridium cellobioparum]